MGCGTPAVHYGTFSPFQVQILLPIPPLPSSSLLDLRWGITFGEDTFTWTIIGARDVLISCAGWFIVSASRTTSCKDLASSKILSISLCTSAAKENKTGLFRNHWTSEHWDKNVLTHLLSQTPPVNFIAIKLPVTCTSSASTHSAWQRFGICSFFNQTQLLLDPGKVSQRAGCWNARDTQKFPPLCKKEPHNHRTIKAGKDF